MCVVVNDCIVLVCLCMKICVFDVRCCENVCVVLFCVVTCLFLLLFEKCVVFMLCCYI